MLSPLLFIGIIWRKNYDCFIHYFEKKLDVLKVEYSPVELSTLSLCTCHVIDFHCSFLSFLSAFHENVTFIFFVLV